MSLSRIWSTTVLPLLIRVVDFFRGSVHDIFTFDIQGDAWYIEFLNWLLNRFIVLIEFLGLDTSVPLWEFLISCLPVVLPILIAVSILGVLRS